ncbi:MAG: hypothetical protein HXX08_00380 [Chloroflexi bacterium]|uniref:Uncharacterized protein n=1 Tax=Candidatus Chlorohelix allophototropha TaxID=3003348 RepID=A0A8T7LYA4_9CHLR|nr:hypothetical protein [Chloroflexota bacterium]WJW66204.1 hypothetical protein OZ401_001995 [Chloroflexota bacterium L227-S17]
MSKILRLVEVVYEGKWYIYLTNVLEQRCLTGSVLMDLTDTVAEELKQPFRPFR